MNYTLLQLRTRARERADMVNSDFIEDTELNSYINASAAELQDLLIAAYEEEYYFNQSTISLVTGTDEYTLPSDFYKMKGVDLQVSSNKYVELEKFDFNQRNQNSRRYPYGSTGLEYRIWGQSKIKFTPVTSIRGGSTIRLSYIPLAGILAADSDVVMGVNGYEEYIVIDAAIKMKTKEDTSVTQLKAEKEAIKRRIEVMAANRDSGSSFKVQDVRGDYDIW